MPKDFSSKVKAKGESSDCTKFSTHASRHSLHACLLEIFRPEYVSGRRQARVFDYKPILDIRSRLTQYLYYLWRGRLATLKQLLESE